MTVAQLYTYLEERVPRALSCDWDNDGLMCCPNGTREVRRVLVALDVTGAVVKRAEKGEYDLIVSHHPLIFRPLRAISGGENVADKTIRLLLSGVSVMSFHTRLDAVAGGVNDTLARLLGLCDVEPLGDGIGRIGVLKESMTLVEFAKHFKRATGAEYVQISDAGRRVQRVALLGGAGSDDLPAAEESGADTYLTGELKHNQLTDAPDRGVNLVMGGHFYTENPVCARIAELLHEADPTMKVDLMNSNPVRFV
ncbi:MAG: Nif3-like dinuclear metal center hexameric protein [Clostridia bacterium]|nr:Nif3-like dinuclear metal center hexameric protein [Clostridia bacterium]